MEQTLDLIAFERLLSSESGRSTKSIEVVQSAISGRFTSDNG